MSGFTSVSTTGSDCRWKLLTRFEPFQHQAPTRQVTDRHGSATTGVAATSHDHPERSKGQHPPLHTLPAEIVHVVSNLSRR